MARKDILTKEKAEALQQLVQRLMRERFNGSQVKMAKATGIRQSQLSAILNKVAGGGMTTAYRLSRFAPDEIAKILGSHGRDFVHRGVAADRAIEELSKEYPRELAEASVTWVLQAVHPDEDDYPSILGIARATAAAGQVYARMASWRRSSAPPTPSRPPAPLRRIQ